MKIFLLINTFLILNASATCVPARKEIDYPDSLEEVGMYHRVHPNGNYLIVSAATYNRRVTIIDLTSDKARAIETPMIDETYPVEGTWNIIASPRNSDGMRFYKFEDVLKQKSEAKPLFNDSEHNEWYHSAAELPGSTPKNLKFRVMLYGEPYRDYEVSYDSKGEMSYKKKEIKKACLNLINYLASPILSKDGTEVAASNRGNTVIYKIKDNGDCELIDNLGFFTSKVNFSYPKKNTKGKIVYNANLTRVLDGVPQTSLATFIYDRDTKTSKVLSPGYSQYQRQYSSYPGMTEDGRVIYIDARTRKIIIVDPNQLDDNGEEIADKSKCIQQVAQNKVLPTSDSNGAAAQ